MKTKLLTLAVMAFAVLLVGVQVAHAYTTTTDPPVAVFTSGSDHPLVFSATLFNSYGTESDSKQGSNAFSFQLNAETVQFWPGPPSFFLYNLYQPSIYYYLNTFTYIPQIWQSIGGAPPIEAWKGSVTLTFLTVTPSQLSNYEVFQGVNVESNSLSVTVTGCAIHITIPASSMYAGVLQVSTCTLMWSNSQPFPTGFDVNGGFNYMQAGVLGYGSDSVATFTGSVMHYTIFEYDCALNGCTYSLTSQFSQSIWTAESSNLTYVANPNSGGYHVNECSESPDKSVC